MCSLVPPRWATRSQPGQGGVGQDGDRHRRMVGSTAGDAEHMHGVDIVDPGDRGQRQLEVALVLVGVEPHDLDAELLGTGRGRWRQRVEVSDDAIDPATDGDGRLVASVDGYDDVTASGHFGLGESEARAGSDHGDVVHPGHPRRRARRRRARLHEGNSHRPDPLDAPRRV